MQSLIPDPLHPMVVHLPVALAVLLPFFAVGAIWLIRRGARPRVAWGVTTLLTAALVGSAWVATETGEQQEDRVEKVVSEAAIHTHEAAAEAFLVTSAAVLLVAAIGLLKGPVGSMGRAAAAVGTLAVLAMGFRVGHSGGQLVYTHGAASAYTPGAGRAATEGSPTVEREVVAQPRSRRERD